MLGEFEEAVHELRRSGHALAEGLEELIRYNREEDQEHFQRGLSAICLAEERLLSAKKKLESYEAKKF